MSITINRQSLPLLGVPILLEDPPVTPLPTTPFGFLLKPSRKSNTGFPLFSARFSVSGGGGASVLVLPMLLCLVGGFCGHRCFCDPQSRFFRVMSGS